MELIKSNQLFATLDLWNETSLRKTHTIRFQAYIRYFESEEAIFIRCFTHVLNRCAHGYESRERRDRTTSEFHGRSHFSSSDNHIHSPYQRSVRPTANLAISSRKQTNCRSIATSGFRFWIARRTSLFCKQNTRSEQTNQSHTDRGRYRHKTTERISKVHWFHQIGAKVTLQSLSSVRNDSIDYRLNLDCGRSSCHPCASSSSDGTVRVWNDTRASLLWNDMFLSKHRIGLCIDRDRCVWTRNPSPSISVWEELCD